MAHTPEPWRPGKAYGAVISDQPHGPDLVRGSDEVTAYGGYMVAESVSPSNQRRIAAAVNACAGIPIEVLEAQASGGLPWNVADQIEQRVQADRLKEALQSLLNIVRDSRGVHGYHLNGNPADWDEFPEVAAAEAVLAKGEPA